MAAASNDGPNACADKQSDASAQAGVGPPALAHLEACERRQREAPGICAALNHERVSFECHDSSYEGAGDNVGAATRIRSPGLRGGSSCDAIVTSGATVRLMPTSLPRRMEASLSYVDARDAA